MPPKKQKEQPSVEKLLLYRIPEPPSPDAFFNIEQPPPYEFPLEQAKIEGVQLIENYFPQEINHKIEQSIKSRIERISKYRDKLCVMGRSRGLLIGDRSMQATGISAVAYGPNFMIAATEDCTLSVFGMDLKPIKQFKQFTASRLTQLKILRTPKEFEGIMLLGSTGHDLTVFRFEKTFFSGLSLKSRKQILGKLQFPITNLVSAPECLNSHLNRDVGYMNTELVCAITMNSVNVIRFSLTRLTFDRCWDLVYQKRNEKEEVCSASWGQANIKSADRQIFGDRVVLTFSFGNKFYLAALEEISQYLDGQVKQKYAWIQSKSLIFPQKTNIAFCQCMKKNEILIVTEENELIIFYTSGIQLFDREVAIQEIPTIRYKYPERLKGQIAQTVSRKSIPTLNTEDMEDLTEQQLKMLNQVPLVSYTHSFNYEYGTNQIYFLTERKFGIYVYRNWKQICDHLKIEQKFESAMLFIVAIYHHENRFDLGLQSIESTFQHEISEYSQILAVEYVKTKLSSLSHMPELLGRVNLDTILMTPIDFMVRINQFSFLFEILRQKIIGYQSEEAFYRVLEPFIYQGRIKFIPEEQLKVTFNYYIEHNRPDILERLAIYFDLKLIDRNLVMQYLLNQKLVVSLAFICTQGNENEFVTPFVKFWGLCENERRNKNYEQAREYALRALWYVRICLQRNMNLKDYSVEKYGHMIEILVINFFTRRMIKSLVEISCRDCLDTLACAFSIEIANIINQSQKFKLPEVRIHKWIKQREGNTNVELMLSGIYDFCREVGMDSESNQLFYLMLSRIIIYKTVAFTRDKYVDIISFLINNYRCIEAIRYGLDRQKVKNIEELCSQEEADEILSSQYLSKLLVLALQEEPTLKDNLRHLFEISRMVPLTQLQAHISFLLRSYKQCIQIYLSGRKTSRKGIFDFLENSFKSLALSKRNSQLHNFSSAVSEYVMSLIGLDPLMSRNLIKTYMPDQQEKLIFALGSDEKLQLDYLKSIISTLDGDKKNLSERAVLLYIELMCKYEPDNLLSSLTKYSSILLIDEESLKVCQKYEAYDCMQYIYRRMGLIEKSVEVACSRIDKVFQNRFQYADAQDAHLLIASILSTAIQTCIQTKTQSIWQSLLDAAIELFNKYRQRPQYSEQMIVFYRIIAKILYYMVNHSSIDYIIHLFQTKYNKLDMGGNMKQAFIEILSNYSYSQNILFSAHDLTKDTYMNELISQKKVWAQGYKTDRVCNSCQAVITRTAKAIGFFCGHIYHEECLPETNPYYCLACLNCNNQQLNFFLTIPNPQNPKVKVEKLFVEADKRKFQIKEKFKVQDFEQSQKNKEQEYEQQKFISRQERFKKYDMMREQAEAKSRQVLEGLEEKFEMYRVYS